MKEWRGFQGCEEKWGNAWGLALSSKFFSEPNGQLLLPSRGYPSACKHLIRVIISQAILLGISCSLKTGYQPSSLLLNRRVLTLNFASTAIIWTGKKIWICSRLGEQGHAALGWNTAALGFPLPYSLHVLLNSNRQTGQREKRGPVCFPHPLCSGCTVAPGSSYITAVLRRFPGPVKAGEQQKRLGGAPWPRAAGVASLPASPGGWLSGKQLYREERWVGMWPRGAWGEDAFDIWWVNVELAVHLALRRVHWDLFRPSFCLQPSSEPCGTLPHKGAPSSLSLHSPSSPQP